MDDVFTRLGFAATLESPCGTSNRKVLAMSSKRFTKSVMAVLGCAGAAAAAPVIVSYLATLSLPFFGTVLGGLIINEKLRERLVEAIGSTATGFMTEVGGHFATDKIPRALSPDHNFHLERMLATAYLNSLKAIEKEFNAGNDEKLKEQAAQILPFLKARIERGLKKKDLSALFLLQTPAQPGDIAFADRFSAENVTLLIANEEKWREQLGQEVETALRRWLDEERDVKVQAERFTQLSLARDTQLPEPLRSRLRAELPHGIAHEISELVKRDEFKESWIAFQRAHLQGIGRVVERIEISHVDISQSVNALARRIDDIGNEDKLVAALAEMQRDYLSQIPLSHDKLALLLERQSEELRGIEQRLSAEIAESTERLSAEGKENTTYLSNKIESLDKKVEEVFLQDARRAVRNRLKQLPAPPRDFTGREAELKQLRQALRQDSTTISGVQGMGGVGKTALALVLADEFKNQYPDAQIYLDLKGMSKQPLSPAEVMWHVVSSFYPDMKRPYDGDLPAWYLDLLNRHRALLFYDNAKDGPQIEALLPPEHCLLLVTSRRHFKVSGMFDKNLEEMAGADAEALLLEIAPRIATDAAAIAKQCGYLPLALRLAASALHKSHSLSPADLLRRLQDKRKRAELVEASFSMSYELLSGELQRRWRILAIFPTNFKADAAATLWQTSVDAAKVSLVEFEEYSLLNWEEATQRYTLHDLARDYADTLLSATEREQASTLHATHYLYALATANNLFLKGGEELAEGLSVFDSEIVNIEAGQGWAAMRFADDKQAAHLCNEYPNAGSYILRLRKHPRDFIRWLESALSSARLLKDEAAVGKHLGNLGNAYDNLSEPRRAIELLEQHLAITREIGDRQGEGIALGDIGVAYSHFGEYHRAIEYYEQRLYIAREIGDRRGEGHALGDMGVVYRMLGEPHRAIEVFEQSLSIARESGNRRSEGHALGNMGVAYSDLGAPRRAIECYEQSLSIAREIGNRRSESNALGNMGFAYVTLDQPRRAIECSEQCLDIKREIGDRSGEGSALGNIGNAYAKLGETEKAIEYIEAALKILEETESPNVNIARDWLEQLRGKQE